MAACEAWEAVASVLGTGRLCGGDQTVRLHVTMSGRYRAGDIAAGKISIAGNAHLLQNCSLWIILEGIECVLSHTERRRKRSLRAERIAFSTSELVKRFDDSPRSTREEELPQQLLDIPCRVQIPPHFVSSMAQSQEYSNSLRTTKAFLSYKLRTELRDAQQTVVARSRECGDDRAAISVSAQFSKNNKESLCTSNIVPLAALCACLSLGSLRIEIRLDQKHVSRGDWLLFTVHLVQLEPSIVLANFEYIMQLELRESVFVRMCNARFGGSRRRALAETRIHGLECHQGKLLVPSHSRESYDSPGLFRVYHHLVVTCRTPWYAAEDASSAVPVIIVPPQPEF